MLIRLALGTTLLLACAWLAAADEPAPAPKPDGGLTPTIGFSHFDAERPQDRDAARLEGLSDLGRALVKTVPVRWGRVEPEPSKGKAPTYHFEELDRAVLLWQLTGLEPVLVLSPRSSWACVSIDSTSWAKRVMNELGTGDAEAVLRSGIGAAPPRTPQWRAWQRFVQDVVERYDGDHKGDMPGLRRPVRYVQVLDRADVPSRWLGSPDEYLRLLNHAHVGAKTANEKTQIVLAGIDLKAVGFDPIPEQDVWKHRVRALLPTSPPAARLEAQRAFEWVERVLEMPRLYDVAPHVGSRNLDDDDINVRHLRAWLDRAGGSDVRIWLVDNPLPKLEHSRVPRALTPSKDEDKIRQRWLPVVRYVRHTDHAKAMRWYEKGLCFDLVRSYCRAHAAGAESVLFFPRADRLPGAALASKQGPTFPACFVRQIPTETDEADLRGPLWHCWDQLVSHLGTHTDVEIGRIGAEGRSVVFQLPVERKHPWIAVLLLDSRLTWAGEPGKPLPTQTTAVPLPNGRYRVEACRTSAAEPHAYEVDVDEGMLILSLGPDPLYLIPIDAE